MHTWYQTQYTFSIAFQPSFSLHIGHAKSYYNRLSPVMMMA